MDFYAHPNTNFVSCSTEEFSEPEFDECDPTPFGGGFDSTQIYGKPLPPSMEICYPPSQHQSDGEGSSYEPIPSSLKRPSQLVPKSHAHDDDIVSEEENWKKHEGID